MHLILGASSGIGRVFYSVLVQKGFKVFGTGYQNLEENDFLYFDSFRIDFEALMKLFRIQNPSDVSWVHFFYGSSDINWIAGNPKESQALNVDSKIAIIEEAIKNNINIGFISTDYIFSGDRDSYSESCLPSPSTLYGKQKVAVEEFIKENTENYLIVRFGPNIFANDLRANCRVTSAYSALIKGNALMAQDISFSLTEVLDSCRAYHALIQGDCRGVFHIASSNVNSWAGLAEKIKEFSSKGNQMRYKSCFIEELQFPESRPQNTSLNNQKLIDSTNIKFGDINKAIKKKVLLLDNKTFLDSI